MSDQPCRSLRTGGADWFLSHGGGEDEDQKECVAGGVEGAREGRGADFAGGGGTVGSLCRGRRADAAHGD